MSKNPTFVQDYTDEAVTCGELTRAVRGSIPYQKDTTADLEVSIDEMPTI